MDPFWLSRDEVRELDRRAINDFGVPGVVLMENAGRGCAELLMRLNPERRPTVILCGPGNNGGDGFVIARHLDNHDWPVLGDSVFLFAPSEAPEWIGISPKLPPDAAVNFRIWSRADYWGIFIDPDYPKSAPAWKSWLTKKLDAGCWIVDALFGTGLTRSLGRPFDEIVALVNASQHPILAVDTPSGLDCDTGEPLGPAVKATHTATFVAHKKGFLNPRSREWTGEVHVIDIGAPRVLIDEYRQRRSG